MHVLFDLDGTLTDPREGIVACLSYALRGLGRTPPPDSELVRFIGPPLHESLAALLGPGGQSEVGTALALYRQRFASQGMFENVVYPGIEPALAELQARGTTLYVATSKPRTFAEQIVEHFGLRHFFRALYGSELDGTRANKGELIAYLLERESLAPESTYLIGDRAHDVRGARATGVIPIGALWGYGSRDELVEAGATALCETPAVLPEVLSSNFALERTGAATEVDAPAAQRGR
jgi:phosphoglycolate phosphatase